MTQAPFCSHRPVLSRRLPPADTEQNPSPRTFLRFPSWVGFTLHPPYITNNSRRGTNIPQTPRQPHLCTGRCAVFILSLSPFPPTPPGLPFLSRCWSHTSLQIPRDAEAYNSVPALPLSQLLPRPSIRCRSKTGLTDAQRAPPSRALCRVMSVVLLYPKKLLKICLLSNCNILLMRTVFLVSSQLRVKCLSCVIHKTVHGHDSTM